MPKIRGGMNKNQNSSSSRIVPIIPPFVANIERVKDSIVTLRHYLNTHIPSNNVNMARHVEPQVYNNKLNRLIQLEDYIANSPDGRMYREYIRLLRLAR